MQQRKEGAREDGSGKWGIKKKSACPPKTATQTSFVALSLGKGGAIDKKIFKGKKFILDRDSLTEEDQTAVIETLRSFGVTKGRIVYAFTKAKNKAGK